MMMRGNVILHNHALGGKMNEEYEQKLEELFKQRQELDDQIDELIHGEAHRKLDVFFAEPHDWTFSVAHEREFRFSTPLKMDRNVYEERVDDRGRFWIGCTDGEAFVFTYSLAGVKKIMKLISGRIDIDKSLVDAQVYYKGMSDLLVNVARLLDGWKS
jgi:hypothetical protein